jgi:molybdopterin adenylyltransferase
MNSTASLPIGILTVSDRASGGVYEDLSGPAIQTYLEDRLSTPWHPVYRVVADEIELVSAVIISMIDDLGCVLVLTTGGTGPALRDITPEATEMVCRVMLPGFGELMRQESLKYVPTAILSRQTAGIRGTSLIVNLPGRPASISQCLDALMPAIPYCLEITGGILLDCYPDKVKVFRPNKK